MCAKPHIKIDVDGVEHEIIKGAEKTLSDRRVKSILVELDSSREDYYKKVIKDIEKTGMQLRTKKHALMFDNGACCDGYNYNFMRL